MSMPHAAGALGGESCQGAGWEEGRHGSQRGLDVAGCSGCYIPQKKQQCWERQRRNKEQDRKLSRDHQEAQAGSAPAQDQAGPRPPLPSLA